MILPLTAPDGQLSINSILRNNPTKRYVADIQDYDWKLTMHNTGIGLHKAIDKFDYYESRRLADLRKKYTPSNKDFFGRLHRPIDKIFNAKGGSTYYYLPEGEKRRFKDTLGNIADGYSLRQWIETFWLQAYHCDPMGLILMEVGDNTCYPTYKSVQTVFAMPKPNGRMFDWLVLKLDDPKSANATYGGPANGGGYPALATGGDCKYYRVLDDAWDYTIKWENGVATVVEQYENHFGFVPAITTSNLWDSQREWYISPDDQVLDIADNHLRSRSVCVIFELEHGFPMHWQYQSSCPTCRGTGKVRASDCPSCNGSGVKSKNDVAERIMLPVPRDKEVPILAPNVAGVVEVAVASWQEMKATIDRQYKEAHYCMWGTHQIEDSASAQPATATGRFIDVQPVNDRLAKYSDAAESIERWITDMLGQFYFDAAYQGCEVNYGRRFLIETPDAIWDKYNKAKTAGANIGALNNLYQQYIDSEYSGDEFMRLKMTLLYKLEPLPHQTLQQAQAAFTDPKDYDRKLYFGQWVNTLTDNDFLTKNYAVLSKGLAEYVETVCSKQLKD